MASSYPVVPGNRIGYDVDGTRVLVVDEPEPQLLVVIQELGPTDITALNDEATTPTYPPPAGLDSYQLVFLFPEVQVLAGYWVGMGYTGTVAPATPLLLAIEASTSTTTGIDGEWTPITLSSDATNVSAPLYRSHITSVPSVAARAVRLTISLTEPEVGYPTGVHFYGIPQAGQLLDQLGIWHSSLDLRASPGAFDWGDFARSSSSDQIFRVKNLANSLSAVTPSVHIDTLSHVDPPADGMHLLSADPPGGPQTFTASLSLATIPPGKFSPVLTVRRVVPSTASLGLWSARIVVSSTSVGSSAETMTGNAVVGEPTPHLWLSYQRSGRLGDQIVFIGTGLGLGASTYHTRWWADYGIIPITPSDPPGSYPSVPDIEVTSISSWTTVSAQPDGYGAGRSIYPGRDPNIGVVGLPPSSTLEYDVVVVNVPDNVMPAYGNVNFPVLSWLPLYSYPPKEIYFYAVSDNGFSNRMTWIAKASGLVSAQMISTALTGNLALRLAAPPTGTSGIEQRHVSFVSDYVIESGTAQGRPLYEAQAVSNVLMGMWAGSAVTGLVYGITGDRWTPRESFLVPAPDLGTGASRWKPSEDRKGGSWVVFDGSKPYVESEYPSSSRTGIRLETAMVFDSTAYADFITPFTGGFSLYMVVQLHATPNAGLGLTPGQLVNESGSSVGPGRVPLATFYDPADPTGYRTCLELVGAAVRVTIRQSTAQAHLNNNAVTTLRPISAMTKQPLIIGFLVSHPGGGVRLYVSDVTTTTAAGNTLFRNSGTPNMVSLGRDIDIGPSVTYGNMDILDLLFSPGVVDPPATSLATIAALDGAYGVVRR